ncbi:Uu.00g110140.m01.CDS01 [Anthostomella pinea]|uniref:Uu.00g110140.m01.CDS01 n=1 Tax=Anthostomella pinea TaxID=933095 RepID=A0AAI8VFC0_9PEZI|nr:Uu.00g110140.m01.CDS01 [Anthostomella pinea]
MKSLFCLLAAATGIAAVAENPNRLYERDAASTNATLKSINPQVLNPFGISDRALQPSDVLARRNDCGVGYDDCGIYCCISGSQTCVSDSSGVAQGCCDAGESLCGTSGCFDAQTEVCCKDNDGYHCLQAQTCCGTACCDAGYTCADANAGTCKLSKKSGGEKMLRSSTGLSGLFAAAAVVVGSAARGLV